MVGEWCGYVEYVGVVFFVVVGGLYELVVW